MKTRPDFPYIYLLFFLVAGLVLNACKEIPKDEKWAKKSDFLTNWEKFK